MNGDDDRGRARTDPAAEMGVDRGRGMGAADDVEPYLPSRPLALGRRGGGSRGHRGGDVRVGAHPGGARASSATAHRGERVRITVLR